MFQGKIYDSCRTGARGRAVVWALPVTIGQGCKEIYKGNMLYRAVACNKVHWKQTFIYDKSLRSSEKLDNANLIYYSLLW